MTNKAYSAINIGEKWLFYRDREIKHTFTVHSVFDKVINILSQHENIHNSGYKMLSIVANCVGGSSAFFYSGYRGVARTRFQFFS